MYGYLRETQELADKAGIDPITGICRTAMEDYLKVIFPNTTDWIHDKKFGLDSKGVNHLCRPDFRSPSLKMIIEIDGLPHYQNPDVIKNDKKNTEFYKSEGYKVIRIPYFIQLTNSVVKQMFNVEVSEDLFPENIPSLTVRNRCTPAYLCPTGVERMREEFKSYPEQHKLNLDYLKTEDFDLARPDLIE